METPSQPLSLQRYREACRGQPYRALVEYHVVRFEADELAGGVRSLLDRLPGGVRPVAERLFNAWNVKGQRREVWALDCSEAVERITEAARRRLRERDAPAGEEHLLRIFRLVTLGLAFAAARYPQVRRRLGISNAVELAAGRGDPGA